MPILFPINEATPIYKIGGLGDVGGSLPLSLRQLDLDVRLALPKHPEISLSSDFIKLEHFPIIYDHQSLLVTVYLGYLPKSETPLYLFAEDRYISKPSNASDNYADKYAVFSLAVATWIHQSSLSWHPHLVHAHDWHTALIPVLLKHRFNDYATKTILTIHNLAYQGDTTTPIVQKLALPKDACQILSWDQRDGSVNIMLEGILHADLITTVSESYAQEILTSEYGEHLESILQPKQALIHGIVNGLDLDYFNPQIDRSISHHYQISTFTEGKNQNKLDIQRRLSLPENISVPLVVFIGRVDPGQKGINLIIEALDQDLFPPDIQFVFLGTGDPKLEQLLHRAASAKPQVKIITQFDESLAHSLYAAANFILIPSRYEPCGLIQLIAMHYGTLPIAFATGGLKDTITDNVTGFLFHEYSTSAMMRRLQEALALFSQTKDYQSLVTKAMSQDFSWDKSAQQYAKLYQSLH